MSWPAPWRRLMVALIACATIVPAAARAGDDGGGRSVFAQGAGNRPLAMGGAYAGVAADAVAQMWNPGGLGRVARFEVQAGQSSYFDLGMSESYLAAVLPNWRWGALAITFRHFGVSGIDGRDSRNFELDGDLSDSETEFALGYGRPLSDAWSVGGSLKARHQSLAGLSASGVGVDVGVTGQPAVTLGYRAPWAQNLSWGLGVNNLVQPSLRLVSESVADPATVRTGFAYRHELMGFRTLVGALDFEKSKATSLRLHAGVELRLYPQLAMRAGLSDGVLTAGTGIQWHDVTLDYVFENNPVGGVHRLGLGFAFGPTVEQSRMAALRAEEAAVEARLAEGFQKRQADQIASLLAQAEERRTAGRYDEALEQLNTVTALEPGNAQATALQAICLHEKGLQLERQSDYAGAAIAFGRALAIVPLDSVAAAGQARVQAESDQRAARSAELRQQFAAALDAFGADRLVAARDGFRAILQAQPQDEDAAQMLRRTEEAISHRTQSLIRQAQRYVQANLLADASTLLAQASALDPGADGLSQTSAALARARQSADEAERQRAAARSAAGTGGSNAAPAAATLSRQQLKEIEMLYKRGMEAMKERRMDDALRYWELVWSADPGYQGVAEYLKREYLTRGMESFAAGRLDEAVDLWQHALKVDPTDERAKGYLARAQKQLERTREILGASE
jgi:tetratricopeptide (TPR) repeat protein